MAGRSSRDRSVHPGSRYWPSSKPPPRAPWPRRRQRACTRMLRTVDASWLHAGRHDLASPVGNGPTGNGTGAPLRGAPVPGATFGIRSGNLLGQVRLDPGVELGTRLPARDERVPGLVARVVHGVLQPLGVDHELRVLRARDVA